MIEIKTDRAKRGLIRTNIAYVLVDAAHSLMMDAMDDFKAEGYVVHKDVRNKLEWLKSAARDLKVRCKDFTYDPYHVKSSTEITNFCEDADFLAKFLLTIVDRSGESDELFKRMYGEARSLPSKLRLL